MGLIERTEWHGCGQRIGWVDGSDLYLELAASYAVAQDLARRLGDGLAVSRQTLCKRLKECGLLVSWERDKTTTRRTLEGRERAVLHLRAASLCAGTNRGNRGNRGDDPLFSGEKSPCFIPLFQRPPHKTGG